MRQLWKEMNNRLKHSIHIAFDIVAGISTVIGVWGFTLKDISEKLKWWHCLLILIALYLVVVFATYQVLKRYKHRPYVTKIKGKAITIKVGDIFVEQGLKVIPCNEYFDTQVDDVIIARNTLNGKMLQNHIDDIEEVKKDIKNALQDSTKLPMPEKKGDKWRFPLGRIVRHKDFAMLSFTHFNDQNEAYILAGEYEQCLLRMWTELRRVYAGEPIVLPLIGSGITDIDGIQEKDNTFLLRCILCTLRSSKLIPDTGVTIVLTDEVMESIDMNIIREEF